MTQSQQATLDRLFCGKEDHRRKLAALPIEAKVRIIVQLQEIAAEIARSTGRTPREPWKLE